MVAEPWNIVGLVIASLITLGVAGVFGVLLKVLVYRGDTKEELGALPEVPEPKLLTYAEDPRIDTSPDVDAEVGSLVQEATA